MQILQLMYMEVTRKTCCHGWFTDIPSSSNSMTLVLGEDGRVALDTATKVSGGV